MGCWQSYFRLNILLYYNQIKKYILYRKIYFIHKNKIYTKMFYIFLYLYYNKLNMAGINILSSLLPSNGYNRYGYNSYDGYDGYDRYDRYGTYDRYGRYSRYNGKSNTYINIIGGSIIVICLLIAGIYMTKTSYDNKNKMKSIEATILTMRPVGRNSYDARVSYIINEKEYITNVNTNLYRPYGYITIYYNIDNPYEATTTSNTALMVYGSATICIAICLCMAICIGTFMTNTSNSDSKSDSKLN